MISDFNVSVQSKMFDIYGHLPNHSYFLLLENALIENNQKILETNQCQIKARYFKSIDKDGSYRIEVHQNLKDTSYTFLDENNTRYFSMSLSKLDNEEIEIPIIYEKSISYDGRFPIYKNNIFPSDVAKDLVEQRLHFAMKKFGHGLKSLLEMGLGFYVIGFEFKMRSLIPSGSALCSSWISEIEGNNSILRVPFYFINENSSSPYASGQMDAVVIDTRSGKPTSLPEEFKSLFFK
ncbi:MAG: hypothetical protein KA116_07710 [Proteobacteria bacterium]|nr:hypothetical protein [Pseudomonadota bacterium]